jgi:hypothetical protein
MVRLDSIGAQHQAAPEKLHGLIDAQERSIIIAPL